MNKKKLLTSLMSIAMLASITTGATYALFTAEDTANIAITSGKVAVTATVDQTTLKTYSMEVEQPYGTFENGGTATFSDESTLNLNLLTPGDGANFNINVSNNSNVKIKYRIKMDASGELVDALTLKATIDGVDYDFVDSKTNWLSADIGADLPDVSVSVLFADAADNNNYQEKAASLRFVVEAVQGNAYTGPTATIERYAESALPTRNPIKGNFGGIIFPDAQDEITVEAAWTFGATDTEVTVQESIYKDWVCDFVIECDDDVALGELGLWGAYGGMDFAFANPIALPYGQTLFMMTSVGMPITYEYICTEVKTFDCGVFRGIVDPKMKDKEISVSLVLINPDYALDLIDEVTEELTAIDPNTTQDEIMMEVMKKSRWESAVGTNVLIANKTVYHFE